MIYYLLLVACTALIIFSAYKHYKQTHVKQLYRPRLHRSSSRQHSRAH